VQVEVAVRCSRIVWNNEKITHVSETPGVQAFPQTEQFEMTKMGPCVMMKMIATQMRKLSCSFVTVREMFRREHAVYEVIFIRAVGSGWGS